MILNVETRASKVYNYYIMTRAAGKIILTIIVPLLIILLGVFSFFYFRDELPASSPGVNIERRIASKLLRSPRRADLLISEVAFDENAGKVRVNAKFTEYDIHGDPMDPEYITFDGDVVQLQSMAIKLKGLKSKALRLFRGKDILLFWKIFLPEGNSTRMQELTPMNTVPDAYALSPGEPAEASVWKDLWDYALSPSASDNVKISNVSIKASERIFIPGTLFELKIDDRGDIGYARRYLAGN
jgi:hypothetical protein